MARAINTQQALPPLRDEVHCYDGPAKIDGSPSWTLHDPANNRFFRIGWLEFEILSRWQLADATQISQAITANTTLNVNPEYVAQFAQFLQLNNLLSLPGEAGIQFLWQQVQAAKQDFSQWLLHNYLFFKVPLFKPDRMLAYLYPRLTWIYSRWFLILVLLIAGTGCYQVSRQWEHFLNTFPHFFNWQGLSQYFIALLFAKMLHELGHALTAHRYGCRVPTMGVAFMVMYPLLYTDVNETWKLNSRKQRMAVAAAGVIAELGLAAFAVLAWNMLDDGPLRSSVFLLATTTWITSLLINFSPFMRFDGYYLLADWLKIENLQPRAFAYNRWHLRRLLFGHQEMPPEALPVKLQRLFIIYAWATWLYRFLLITGIALMVYHLFFKLLGIVLMAVEIYWFIVKPIWAEVKNWRQLAKTTGKSLHGWYGIGAVILGLLVFPWQQSIEIPAVIKAGQHADIYLPYPAKLSDWRVVNGQTVSQGEVLAELTSNDLQQQVKKAGMEAEVLSWQLSYQGVDQDLNQQRQVLLQQFESAGSKQQGIQHKIDQLKIVAPIAGVVLDRNDQLQTGQWFKAGEPLMVIVNLSQFLIESYVNERDIMEIPSHTKGRFYPENLDYPSLDCELTGIDNSSIQSLPAMMASSYGGPIAARAGQDKRQVPEAAQYRIQLAVSETVESLPIFPAQQRGHLKLELNRRSIIERIWKQFLAIVWRELGF